MRNPARALLLGVIAALAACDAENDEIMADEAPLTETPCIERFQKVLAVMSEHTSPAIDVTFQLPDEPPAKLLRQLTASEYGQKPDVQIVQGNSDRAVEAFQAGPVAENGAFLLGDKAFYRRILEAPTPSEAIGKACAMERDEMRIVSLRVSLDKESAGE